MYLLLIILLIPISVYAVEQLQIKFNSKIEIDKAYKITYGISDLIKESEIDNYRLLEGWYS